MSQRTDNYGFERVVENYEVDPVQPSEELDQLARMVKRQQFSVQNL